MEWYKKVFAFIIFYSWWVAMSGNLSVVSLVLGGIFVLLIVSTEFEHFNHEVPKRIITGIILYILYLLLLGKEIFIASFKFAYLVLHPQMSLNPNIVKVPTEFKEKNKEIAMSVLAKTITLIPGTVAVDLDTENNDLYVHWLNVQSNEPTVMRNEIYGRFERIIGGIFQ